MQNFSFLQDKKILFAEDDAISLEQSVKIFKMFFKNVLTATNGDEALRLYEDESPDIVITDIKMPRRDGISLARSIRKNDYHTPIILISSYCENNLLFQAANLSIDAYLVKPVRLDTLTEALAKAFKRVEKRNTLLNLGNGLLYNTETKEIYRNEELITLGVKETNLLALLIENRNRTVSLEEISYCLWSFDQKGESALKNSILRIRKKLREDLIVSVRGIGYRINIPT